MNSYFVEQNTKLLTKSRLPDDIINVISSFTEKPVHPLREEVDEWCQDWTWCMCEDKEPCLPFSDYYFYGGVYRGETFKTKSKYHDEIDFIREDIRKKKLNCNPTNEHLIKCIQQDISFYD